ncbi:protein translocase subunit SecF [Rhodohalobacter sulfatireducens]|uniref:Protein-export membrane protein SecF n=1 Tax=Rhodohalobacter sulfatireducens TaxID=2911366 RepID=A0ABS9KEU8_9BACT|nr:protein translocase subunit SecF [Rhodohalobacter sulfatireducens]MCG2589327.1 protein translocase subunit SecF [Rhodohalobacter sulfatireducens]MDR9364495.1 protein translocase subunit SecF [Balneolaceae bacterium]MDR9407497.1 protein translocase subunit SecF [Balneolaceae bacterium]
MRWFETPSFDFIKATKVAYFLSGSLIIISIVAIFTMGLTYGIDFRGGQEFVFDFDNPVDVVEVRSELTEPLGSTPEVKLFGSESEILVRVDTEEDINQTRETIISNFNELYPDNPVSVEKTDLVGPRFAEDLRIGALYSIIFALAVVFIYIFIRFKGWYFSAGAIAALAHDVLIVLGVFTLMAQFAPFDVSIDQTIIAAFLTIVGYSLNDTVVVFDRIRENSLVYKTMNFQDMINKSLNDTLSRTVITSLTTLFVVTVLFIFGGEVLKGFAFALVIGVILGTYSSLFVASALVVELQKRAMQAKS